MEEPNPLHRTQLESNRQSRGAWHRFGPHRRRLTELIRTRAGTSGSLCILGAGNCNDVDLRTLGDLEIHLVDLDVDALRHGLARQGMAEAGNVSIHAPLDLSGLLAHLDAARVAAGRRLRVSDLTARLEEAPRPELPGSPFDIVVSAAIMTQMFQSLVDSALRADATVEMTLRLRHKHLRDLIELARPGGAVLLVTDVVSTSTAPELPELPPSALEPRMAALIAAGNFFTGTNPYRIAGVLEEDPAFAPHVENVEICEPWLWAVTPERRHLTCAVSFWRRG